MNSCDNLTRVVQQLTNGKFGIKICKTKLILIIVDKSKCLIVLDIVQSHIHPD